MNHSIFYQIGSDNFWQGMFQLMSMRRGRGDSLGVLHLGVQAFCIEQMSSLIGRKVQKAHKGWQKDVHCRAIADYKWYIWYAHSLETNSLNDLNVLKNCQSLVLWQTAVLCKKALQPC